MSTAPDTSPRERLLDGAIRLLGKSGPEALKARPVAAEIGASTMAVYTHFGGMPQLIDAVADEGFARFGSRLAEVPRTDDPVADLLRLGLAYREFARAFPQLYRLMFGLTTNAPPVTTVDELGVDVDGPMPVGMASFHHLLDAVEAVLAAGRIHPAEALSVAAQMWSVMHGYVLLELAGFLGAADEAAGWVMLPLTRNLFLGLGDAADAFDASVAQVIGGPSA